MEKKKCSKCNITKPLSEFYHDLRASDTYRSDCKLCNDALRKKYVSKNMEEVKARHRRYAQKNKERISNRAKENYQKDIKKQREKSREYRKNHLKESRARVRNHYQKNKSYYLKRNNLRNRRLGFFKFLENPFPSELKVVWHHVNDMVVIPVPKKIHTSNLGPEHREIMNAEIKKLYGLSIKKLIDMRS